MIIPNVVKKIVLGAQIMAQKRNQNGSLRHLELISIGYFWHIADFPLLILTSANRSLSQPR